MSAVIEGFASNNLLNSFVANRLALPLALSADFEIFDLRDEVYALIV